ncbi:ATP-binding protein [Pedobacter sp. WC2423]|uniref:hybrid sensor histidine kinase/response regulator transcription factor n=1 Tax=Pedobacter sp. WC2423 TaxID=3234142 RepID=UPI003465E284
MQADQKRGMRFIFISILMTITFVSGCSPKKNTAIKFPVKEPLQLVPQESLYFLITALIITTIFTFIACYLLYQNHAKNKQLELKNRESLIQQEELIALSTASQATAEAKFSFFTHISNAFRVPLTLILLPLDEMLDSKNSLNIPKQQLNLIHKNVQRLLLMVNQLTDFRKIEYDKMKLEPTCQDLVAFSRDIIASFKALASRKNIELKLSSSVKEIMVWFDKNMFDKVLFNLLSNAIKFSPENGKIQFSIKTDSADQTVDISVSDSGNGMTEEEIKHVFDLFYQADKRNFFGSGLGLSLSKEITELHQGTITIQSQKGYGTTFYIKLPLKQQSISETPAISNDFAISSGQLSQYTVGILPDSLPEAVIAEQDNYLNEETLLIIEENEELLEYLKNSFKEEYEVLTASSNSVGLKLAYEMIPDLIITDITLNEQFTLQITSALKNDDRTSHIPIIILTANGDEAHKISEFKQMADLYMTKPFNFILLKESVKSLLWNRKVLQRKFSNESPVTQQTIPLSRSDKKFMHDFTSTIEQNIANDKFNVDDIASALGISRIQLYRKTKVLLDCTINDYILNRRLKKAKYLLINEDLSISEITYQVGFSSPTYFSTVFKSKYNCTPSSYKKQIGSNT